MLISIEDTKKVSCPIKSLFLGGMFRNLLSFFSQQASIKLFKDFHSSKMIRIIRPVLGLIIMKNSFDNTNSIQKAISTKKIM